MRWCLIGNVVENHEYGEEKEIKTGSKHFRPGAKVYIAPANWGDGYENVIVIGCPRHGKRYIEVVMRSELIRNFRAGKVYAPAVLKMMEESEYRWWGDTDKERIEELAESWKKVKER